jgi:hypothetical protein
LSKHSIIQVRHSGLFHLKLFPTDFYCIAQEFRPVSIQASRCDGDLILQIFPIKISSIMKLHAFFIFFAITAQCTAQNLQLHYDFRHSLDSKLHAKNFASLSFEYFKLIDTLGTGSFLLKVQADLNGKNNNAGQVFTQISQSLRFWRPKIFLSLNYSGGLGVTPVAYGYYIASSYAVGISYPFQWQGAWLATSLLFRYNTFEKPSYDPQFTFYFGKGINNNRLFIAGSFVFWTQNKNLGDDFTQHLKGKKIAFFGDPQIWLTIIKGVSAGTRINVFHHLLTDGNEIQFYPTVGIKYQF